MNNRTPLKTGQAHPRTVIALLGYLWAAFAVVLMASASVDNSASAGTKTNVKSRALPPSLAQVAHPAPSKASSPLTTSVKIAFQSHARNCTTDCNNHIWAMNPDGSGRIQLTTFSGQELDPEGSQGGTKIAFVRLLESDDQIFSMNADGSEVFQVTHDASASNRAPTWSPDATRIAYEQRTPGNQTDIYAINADGTGQIRLTFSVDSDSHPRWSPNGTKIAFDSSRDGSAFGDNQIYVMNPDGTNQQNISNNQFNDHTPAWSPDGTRIAFFRLDEPESPHTGHTDIYVMNANGSNQALIVDGLNTSNDKWLTWSPDGSKIAFSDYTGKIYTINANGSGQTLISNPLFEDDQPSWFGRPPKAQVVDEAHQPVPNAELYRNCVLLGTTDAQGLVRLPDVANGDHLVARALIYTGTTVKSDHDGWSYHVWLTNIDQNNDGTQTDYVITNTAALTQTVTIKKSDAQIGFNLLASFEYNASSDNISDLAAGIPLASKYLFDVTDGQMFIEKFDIAEDKASYTDADLRLPVTVWPKVDSGQAQYRAGPTGNEIRMHMPGPGFDGKNFRGSWQQPNAYRTLVHEFAHYAIGALDEYKKYTGTVEMTATCTLGQQSLAQESRASIMDRQYISSELCTGDNHNTDTYQGQRLNESVWNTLVRNWRDTEERWLLRTPTLRGMVNPGPFDLPCMSQPYIVVNESPAPACSPILLHVQYVGGKFYDPINMTLQHGTRLIDQGTTDTSDNIYIYGAAPGDVVSFDSGYGNNRILGTLPITSCVETATVEGTFLITNTESSQVFTVTWGPPPALLITWQFRGIPEDTPEIYVSQDGLPRQPVSLTYHPETRTYTGSYPFDPARSANFHVQGYIVWPNNEQSFSQDVSGQQFQAEGPFIPRAGEQVPGGMALAPPAQWTLLPDEGTVGLMVSASSLPDGTGVSAGDTDLPAPPPAGLMRVGGPYDVEGTAPPNGPLGLSMTYQAEYFCGLQPGTAAIHRYNGTGWDPHPTTLQEIWHQAYTSISQWGIYAVFAQTNPVPTFSDVSPGSTFHDYIGWLACHSVVSGYADGTFRPTNNTTRGQISKMVALAYNWSLEPPGGLSEAAEKGGIVWQWRGDGGQAHSFADVLPGSTFYLYVESVYRMGVVSGYPCGGQGEPCDAQQRPYFRPANNVTRGQIAKIVTLSSHFNDPLSGQSFEDAQPGSTFYDFVERMASQEIINGYPCGGPGEPCVPPLNRPYFRPANNATRGQLSKMIYLAVQPR